MGVLSNRGSFIKILTRLSAVALCLVVAACDFGSSTSSSSASRETLFDRINRTGVIRAAYVVYPPSLSKDPNSGAINGISAEVMQRVADDLGLKLQWTEEVGWSTMIEGLQNNRYDIVVSGIWPNASRARHADFSIPLFYSGIGAYVRSDDDRFSAALDNVNSPEITIATIDGEMSDIIARAQFPSAKRVSLPQLSDVSQALLNVEEKKADMAFVEPAVAALFLRHSPGALKNLRQLVPVRVFGNTIMFKQNEYAFARMLNIAIETLENSGEVDAIVAKYEPAPGAFYRVAPPYSESSQQSQLRARSVNP